MITVITESQVCIAPSIMKWTWHAAFVQGIFACSWSYRLNNNNYFCGRFTSSSNHSKPKLSAGAPIRVVCPYTMGTQFLVTFNKPILIVLWSIFTQSLSWHQSCCRHLVWAQLVNHLEIDMQRNAKHGTETSQKL